MNDFVQVLVIVLIALGFTGISFLVFRRRGPWGSLWSFFAMVLLGIWVASLWIAPTGPIYWGVAWLPILLVGLVLSLLLISIRSGSKDQRRDQEMFREQRHKQRREDRAFRVLNVSFWLLLLALATIVVLGYSL